MDRGDRHPRCAVVAVGVAGWLALAASSELSTVFRPRATGALRGLGDTRSPMLAHLAGYWDAGPAVAYLLCSISAGRGGLWVACCAALIPIGSVLLVVWKRQLERVK